MSSQSDTPNDSSTPEQEPESTVNNDGKASWGFRFRLLAALLMPVFLETIDYTIVATAQPHIASAFNRLDLQGWIGTAYLLTSTVFLPLYASLSDVFGRHWALQTSLIWFLVGSALSTGAQNMPMILAGRGIAGVGAAGFITVVRIILADSRSLNENTFQTSMLILLYSIGYSVGPVIGGALTSVSFRWVFAINLPCAALSMTLLFVLIRGRIKGPQPSARQRARTRITHAEKHPNKRRYSWLDKFLTIDFVGAFLFISGGILLLLALSWGSTTTWNSARVISCFIVGGLLIVALIGWEMAIDHYDDPERFKSPPMVLETEPMLPIPVFKNPDTVICQFASFTSGMLMLVAFYFVAIFFTIVSGQDPTKSGVQLIFFAPGVGGGVISSIYLIRFLRQPKYPIILGSAIIPISLGLISRAINIDKQSQVNGFMAMAGVGTGLSFGPLGIHARFSQPANRVAVIESLQLFFRTLGGTVGLAQCAAVLNAKVKSHIANLIRTGVLSASQLPPSALSGSSISISSIQEINNLPPNVTAAIRAAYRDGTRWAFISLIPWTGLAFIAVLFLTKIKDTDRIREITKGASKDENPNTVSDSKSTPKEAAERPTVSDVKSTPKETTERSTRVSDPKPSKKGVIGPISFIIYLVKKKRWEKRQRKLAESSEDIHMTAIPKENV